MALTIGAGHKAAAAAALVLLAAGVVVGGLVATDFDMSVETAVREIRALGMWGVAGSIGLMVAHSFLPFPAEIIACANGIVYGAFWGTVITWIGAMLGASATFALVRWLGRPFVERMVPTQQWTQLTAWSRTRGGAVLLTARLVPVIAFNLINYVAALSGISWWTFLWATGIGILPLTILLALLGDQMLSMPLWAWVLLGALAAASWVVLHWRWRAIDAAAAPPHQR
jgi:uncharacterized membrane protein YdjX (TVP38/TMEM64 family)